MKWYYIAAITLGVYWSIGVIIVTAGKDEWAELWAMGLVYPILYVLAYPVRAWRTYTKSRVYYENHGISRWQYMFGKRANRKEDTP